MRQEKTVFLQLSRSTVVVTL